MHVDETCATEWKCSGRALNARALEMAGTRIEAERGMLLVGRRGTRRGRCMGGGERIPGADLGQAVPAASCLERPVGRSDYLTLSSKMFLSLSAPACPRAIQDRVERVTRACVTER
jgi:hypothetical protein